MKIPFPDDGRLIPIQAEFRGPAGASRALLALDTGSSWTVIDPSALATAGYDRVPVGVGARIVTPSGVASARFLDVESFTALGLTIAPFRVMVLQLPAEARVQGLLGLDFLRRGRLAIDFPKGQLEFAPA